MAGGGNSGPIHHARAVRSQYEYLFYVKHHGQGGPNDAQWLEEVTQDEEFHVFDEADRLELFDEGGNLYGLLLEGSGRLRVLGTWRQQLARFPAASAGQPWHGYPHWPIGEEGPANRRKQATPKSAMTRMVAAGLLTRSQATRLRGGKHV